MSSTIFTFPPLCPLPLTKGGAFKTLYKDGNKFKVFQEWVRDFDTIKGETSLGFSFFISIKTTPKSRSLDEAYDPGPRSRRCERAPDLLGSWGRGVPHTDDHQRSRKSYRGHRAYRTKAPPADATGR